MQVVTFYPGGAFREALEESGAEVHSIDKRGRWDLIGFGLRLVRFLRQQEPEVVHGYLSVPNMFAVLAKPFLRRSRIVLGIRSSDVDWSHYGLLTRLAQRAERWLSRFADLVIVNSRAGFNHASSTGWAVEKWCVIPNGIDVRTFHPDREGRERVRREWGVEAGQRIIGLVGRIDPLKDHGTFLRAAARFADDYPEAIFVCVGNGTGAYKEKMLLLACELGISKRLRWEKGRKDMKDVYNALDILCSASVSEGFPNVVGEAMACGVPCVVTDAGDSALIVGDAGVVVPRADPAALARGWGEMFERMEREGSELRERVRARVVENFAVERLIERTEQVLRALL